MNKKMIQQAQQMQARLKSIQDEISQTKTESSAGGGVVKVTILGGNKIDSISIDPTVVDPDDIEMLEDLIIAAHADAKQKLKIKTDEEISKVTGGVNLPEGFKFPV